MEKNKHGSACCMTDDEYIKFLPLISQIDKLLQEGSVTLAIEGGSASGKTTLAEVLAKIYGCNVFHMDDFFLRPEQRTPERYAEAGGNVDRERFLEEVLIPHSERREVCYRRFDCSSQTLLPPVRIMPTQLTVVEGAYSMHPELRSYYDLSVFLNITPERQKERILKRNSPQMAERFFAEWIPFEQAYFSHFGVRESCDMSFIIE